MFRIVDDRLDIRVAGEWTKRDGYSFNEQTGQPIDGRDLWSSRVTLGWKPASKVQTYLVWEHFSEDDDRLRSGKQLCTNDPGPVLDRLARLGRKSATNPQPVHRRLAQPGLLAGLALWRRRHSKRRMPARFRFVVATLDLFGRLYRLDGANPYAGVVQSQNLRVIDSLLAPSYRAKNDTIEFNANYDITPALTLTSQTGYNNDFLYSTEDYDRFNSAPGLFQQGARTPGG